MALSRFGGSGLSVWGGYLSVKVNILFIMRSFVRRRFCLGVALVGTCSVIAVGGGAGRFSPPTLEDLLSILIGVVAWSWI